MKLGTLMFIRKLSAVLPLAMVIEGSNTVHLTSLPVKSYSCTTSS
jgi:hypothetical protein